MKWGVYDFIEDKGPSLSLESQGRLKKHWESEWRFLKRSLEISWFFMWKKPQSLQALDKVEIEEGCNGWEMSNMGRSTENLVLDDDIIMYGIGIGI